MKKLVACFIICAFFMTMLPISASAEETEQRYTVEQMGSIANKYESNEDMLNTMFCDDTYIGYWAIINDIKQNGALTWALDMSSKLIDEYPEKQDYAEILANLITMQSGELAEQIETQSRFDDLKNIGDYAWDVVEIASAFVGTSGALETISTAIDTGVNGVSDVIIKNSDQAKYYEATLQDYSQSFAFLSAISQYAENEELRNVASSLLDANNTLLVKRLEYLVEAGGNIAEYEAKFFVKNMSMELLKEADLYATDETVKWFVDEGINLKNVLLAAKDAAAAAFKITILAGDIGFGTSNVYNRYQEMRVVADVASALVKANEAISVPLQTSEPKLEAIQEKCNYYKALLVTHARGEYLLYQLLMNDAGAVSDIRWIIEYFKNPEETTDAWYEGQIDVLTTYCDVLDNIFVLDSEILEEDTVGESIMLTQEEQYRINIFLSNFSEQWFHESSSEKFESENADSMDMIEFACLYLKLNGNDTVEFLMYNDYSYAGFSIEAINSATQRFFNRTVTVEEIVPVQLFDDYYNYIVLNDMVCFAWGDGETYNNMTVAKEMYDLGNGTMQVEFDIYSVDIDNYNLVDIGGGIKDKNVYYYTQTDAEAHSDLEFHLSGVAVVKPYIASDGKETYQLISYELAADGENGIDKSTYHDMLTGTYSADYENVKITITCKDNLNYYITYIDLTSGTTLENIPLAYFNSNTATNKMLMFQIDDYYPDHCGYVEIYWTTESIFEYSYNALIEGLEDTDGYYSTLTKE